MTATTMHFGPEWMRNKQNPTVRPQAPSSPPPAVNTPPGVSTYSALVSPAPPPQPEKRDETHPFRYSKEEMLNIFKEGGGRGGLGLEVERWEGVVRELGVDPIGLREMSDAEKKLFTGSLNSEVRRRQSTDYLSTSGLNSAGERPRLNHSNSSTGSPLRERFGGLSRRRDSTGYSDQAPQTLPRKLSLSSGQGPLHPPRDSVLPSPRNRIGFASGFDGVLNGGDSWIARRRASEGLMKNGLASTSRGDGEAQKSSKASEIREEDEEVKKSINDGEGPPQKPDTEHLSSSATTQQHTLGSTNESSGSVARPQRQNENPSVHSKNNDTTPTHLTGQNTSNTIGPPPGLTDIASVEWTYLDPSGKEQGPFRADLMQKWYDDGYFTPDLLMRCPAFGNEWIPVGELKRRAGGEKLFLSLSLQTNHPPGLSRPTESPLHGFPQLADPGSFNNPIQPQPIQSLRTSTLDSYFGTSSNPSDSPSSSYSAGRFASASPDPFVFRGTPGSKLYALGESSSIGHGAGLSGPNDSSAMFSGIRRSPYDPQLELVGSARSSPFGNPEILRPSSIDNFGYVDAYAHPQLPPWSTPSSNLSGPTSNGVNSILHSADMSQYPNNFGLGSGLPSSGFSGFGNHQGSFDINPSNAFLPSDQFIVGGVGNRRDGGSYHENSLDENLTTSGHGYNNYGQALGQTPIAPLPQGQQFSQPPSLSYALPQQSPIPSGTNRIGQHSGPNDTYLSDQPLDAPSINTQAPWSTPEPKSFRQPGPFDPHHPTANNTIPVPTLTPSQTSPWGRTSRVPKTTPIISDSPWVIASQTAPDESWKAVPQSSSLTFQNVGEHNQQGEEKSVEYGDEVTNIPNVSNLSLGERPAEPSTPSQDAVTTLSASKSRRKSTAPSSNATPPIVKTAAPVAEVAKLPSSPQPLQAKAAWALEEEAKKPKPSAPSSSLREIQEAEVKKLEARKTAERERAPRTVPPPLAVAEESHSFTASWGLPTSQAGAARSNLTPKESAGPSASSPSVSTPPVWSSAVKAQPAKKGMKEIQEEEERRKKLAVKESTAAAAAKRAYPETTHRNPAPATPPASAWTTVGPSGKSAVATAAPTRPAITPSSSAATVPASPSGARANGTTSRPPAPPSAKVDDFPVAPSHEFLKWLNDSLKGLNSSVNVEEIMSMLLSFPLDPDPSTSEIISDLIYANSTTLDGRRFASDFIKRRKTDAASRPRGLGKVGAASKPVSIADVVKAQPKASQPEWGGFKVVNKKKKGGRS